MEYAFLRYNTSPKRHFATRSNPYQQKMDCFVKRSSFRRKIVSLPKESQLIWVLIIRTVTLLDKVTLFRPSDVFWHIDSLLTKWQFFWRSYAFLAKWRIFWGWKGVALVAKWRVFFQNDTLRKFLPSLKAMIRITKTSFFAQ